MLRHVPDRSALSEFDFDLAMGKDMWVVSVTECDSTRTDLWTWDCRNPQKIQKKRLSDSVHFVAHLRQDRCSARGTSWNCLPFFATPKISS